MFGSAGTIWKHSGWHDGPGRAVDGPGNPTSRDFMCNKLCAQATVITRLSQIISTTPFTENKIDTAMRPKASETLCRVKPATPGPRRSWPLVARSLAAAAATPDVSRGAPSLPSVVPGSFNWSMLDQLMIG
jgi:hypothetical protein